MTYKTVMSGISTRLEIFIIICQNRAVIRASPSGKALGFGPSIRGFESLRPSHVRTGMLPVFSLTLVLWGRLVILGVASVINRENGTTKTQKLSCLVIAYHWRTVDYVIHGNYWRPLSYFGNINSSHGCVSTVPSEAEWMYDWTPIGTPVIVYT